MELDFIWWLVTPQNPIKSGDDLKPYGERMGLCLNVTRNEPQIIVTDIERQMRVSRSYDTIRGLQLCFPGTSFVMVTGMDNALIFHKWWRWRDILNLVPTAHIARPPAWSLIEQCPLRLQRSQNHRYLHKGERVDLSPGHTYWILDKKQITASSTILREKEKAGAT